MSEDQKPTLVEQTFEWYFHPPEGGETLPVRRALAWLDTVPASVTSMRIGYREARAASIIEMARHMVRTEELPEWHSHDQAVGDLTRLLERAHARLQEGQQ